MSVSKLDDPLELQEVSTNAVNLHPTENLVKPVIVMSSPMPLAVAERVGGGWLFDGAGNPNHFKGTIKLPLEVSGGSLNLKGAKEQLIIEVQKIGSFNVTVEEAKGDDESGLTLHMRAHLKQIDLEQQEQLDRYIELVKFVARLNKAKFEATINPAQGNLFGKGSDGPQKATGIHDLIEFAVPVGRHKPGISLKIELHHEDEDHMASWEIRGVALTGAPMGGEAVTEDSRRHSTRDLARTWAFGECIKYLNKLDISVASELKARSLLLEYCYGQEPSYRKPDKSEKASVQ